MKIDSTLIKGLPELRASLKEFSDRRMAAAVATALTRTAKTVAQQWQEQIIGEVDKPAARTQSATTFLRATAQSLTATVLVKNQQQGTPAASYLGPLQFGGARQVKKFERSLIASGVMPRGYVTVPGRSAEIDGYGGVSRSQIISVLAALGTDYSPGYARVISKSTEKKLAKLAKRGKRYTVVQPGEERQAGASPGIYERQPDGTRRAVFVFKKAAVYTRQLRLIETAPEQVMAVFEVEARRAVQEAAARLAARGSA